MRYYIPGAGYVATSHQFRLNDTTYPKGWLASATADELAAIGAVPPPAYDSTLQVLEMPPEGWHVRDLTPEELAAREAAAQAAREHAIEEGVERMWRECWEVWGEKQLAAVDRLTLSSWASSGRLSETGIQMWQAIIDWHDLLFSQYYPPAKQAIIDAGGYVEPDWDSWPPCPHPFLSFVEHRIA